MKAQIHFVTAAVFDTHTHIYQCCHLLNEVRKTARHPKEKRIATQYNAPKAAFFARIFHADCYWPASSTVVVAVVVLGVVVVAVVVVEAAATLSWIIIALSFC